MTAMDSTPAGIFWLMLEVTAYHRSRFTLCRDGCVFAVTSISLRRMQTTGKSGIHKRIKTKPAARSANLDLMFSNNFLNPHKLNLE